MNGDGDGRTPDLSAAQATRESASDHILSASGVTLSHPWVPSRAIVLLADGAGAAHVKGGRSWLPELRTLLPEHLSVAGPVLCEPEAKLPEHKLQMQQEDRHHQPRGPL